DHVSLDIAVACCPLLNGSPIAAEVAGWLERLDLPEPVLSGDNDSPERREPLTHEHWYLYEMIVARDGEPEVNMATKLMNAPHCLLQRFAILYGFKIAWPVEVTPNGFLRYAQPGQPEDSEVVDLEVQVVLQELASTLGLAVEIFWSGLSFYAKWPRANMWLGDGTDLESAKDRLRALAASPYTPRREVSDG
ncbi:hypothetical protein KJ596_00035, partial [Patescibacteria group bacterium]|nr:hypothetical protein [Patescibacteria group bacterium]